MCVYFLVARKANVSGSDTRISKCERRLYGGLFFFFPVLSLLLFCLHIGNPNGNSSINVDSVRNNTNSFFGTMHGMLIARALTKSVLFGTMHGIVTQTLRAPHLTADMRAPERRRGAPITDVQQLKGRVTLEVADLDDDDDDSMLEDVKATHGAGSAFGDAKKTEAQQKRQEERAAARAIRDAQYHLKADKVHMVGSQTRKATADGSKYYTLHATVNAQGERVFTIGPVSDWFEFERYRAHVKSMNAEDYDESLTRKITSAAQTVDRLFKNKGKIADKASKYASDAGLSVDPEGTAPSYSFLLCPTATRQRGRGREGGRGRGSVCVCLKTAVFLATMVSFSTDMQFPFDGGMQLKAAERKQDDEGMEFNGNPNSKRSNKKKQRIKATQDDNFYNPNVTRGNEVRIKAVFRPSNHSGPTMMPGSSF